LHVLLCLQSNTRSYFVCKVTRLLCALYIIDEADKSLVNCASCENVVKYRFEQNVKKGAEFGRYTLKQELPPQYQQQTPNTNKNYPHNTNSRRPTQTRITPTIPTADAQHEPAFCITLTVHRTTDVSCHPQLHYSGQSSALWNVCRIRPVVLLVTTVE